MYYGEKLMAYDKERKDESSYLRWYRYESYEWQSLITEWLYHLQHTSQRDAARLMFLKIYIDAFWWWGAYESFPFCERLLSEGRRIQISDKDREWFRLIQNFHAAFPTGYQKRGKGNWSLVQTALCCLRQISGIDGEAAKLDSDRRHVRAITDIFLSHAHFYQELKDLKAEKYLLEALKIFEEDQDEWNVNWTLFHLADLYMNWRNEDKAFLLIQRVLSLALRPAAENRDYEIIAGVHRVTADVYWHAGQREKSFRHYACAVGAAYLYHGTPSPPDLYTRSLQREMMDRALTRLKEVRDTGERDAAFGFLQTLWQFFLPYWKISGQGHSPEQKDVEGLWESGQKENLLLLLFPPLPKDEELNQRGAVYADHARRMLKELILESSP
jgi:hypothetical protein